MLSRPSLPARLLAGLGFAVAALAVTAIACVVIVLIGDAIEIHDLMLSGG